MSDEAKKEHGPVRNGLETIKKLAATLGEPMEDAADFLDRLLKVKDGLEQGIEKIAESFKGGGSVH